MHPDKWLICALFVLTACGSGSASDQNENPPAADRSASADEGTGEPVELASAQEVDCDQVKAQTAPSGEPADDILGIRRGMTEKQTRDIFTCQKAYAINASQQNVGTGEGTQMSRIDLVGDSGLDRMRVSLVGPPGGERVFHIERTVEYATGKGLPVESIKQEVSQKYGDFDVRPYNDLRGDIVRSLDGQRLSPDNSNYSTCNSHYLQTGAAVPCLNVVSYQITSNSQNKALAQRFAVTITNHRAAAQMMAATEVKNASDLERARATAQGQGIEL